MTSLWRILVSTLIGGLAALAIGLVWVRFAPDNGFADLAAASVTRIVLVPMGLAIGALVGWLRVR